MAFVLLLRLQHQSANSVVCRATLFSYYINDQFDLGIAKLV
ncbi:MULTISPECIES: hypothetical protein [Rheinheimera]|uniref:Uncharacterized protein n=1 Tax=Rheinheimera marina TaxID=1774958 RepID=A0ABV9JR20_9GAMM